MTDVGFWKDDAQVAREVVEKRWSSETCGIYVSIKALDGGARMGRADEVVVAIARAEENLEFYKRIADNLESILTGGGYKGVRETPRPSSPDPHPHEDKMVRLMDAKDMLEKTEKELEVLRAEFNAMLSQVTKVKCRDVLYRRFVLGQNYKEIALIHGQSVDNMYKLRNEGLCMIEGYRPGNYYGL